MPRTVPKAPDSSAACGSVGEGVSGTWKWRTETLDRYTVRAVVALSDGRRLTWEEVLALWRCSGAFRSSFNRLLAGLPFAAYRWETPAIAASGVDEPFEFVAIDSPELEKRADPAAFAEHFRRAGSDAVVAFQNLGGDARLVAPCPGSRTPGFAHLAAFAAAAPEAQWHALWITVAREMAERLGARPVWLNTAGAGVAWLHLRLDDRPKYYLHKPYRVK